MQQVTTVIFDMFETLAQNPPGHWRSTFQTIVKDQGFEAYDEKLWREWSAAETEFRDSRVTPGAAFRSYYQGWRDNFTRAFASLSLAGDAEDASHRTIQDLSNRPPYAETVEALGLVQKGWRIAVLSNADDDFLLPNLARLGIEFEAILSSEEAQVYKPRPELFQEMLRRLKVSPQEAVYVGDKQLEDVQGAKEVGMGAVWINRYNTAADPKLPQPDYKINSLSQLPSLLAGEPASPVSRDGA
ncbi:MAG: hypothetical protein BZY88_10950 [SAR202 cluster bacterium Io17-Chloro-G9]|nr:MAG: hypothetical protein BZY88_10950 [SAR202 cluster bacterium Io17-Chloro-G9]